MPLEAAKAAGRSCLLEAGQNHSLCPLPAVLDLSEMSTSGSFAIESGGRRRKNRTRSWPQTVTAGDRWSVLRGGTGKTRKNLD